LAIVVPYGYSANENKVGEAQSFSFKPIPVEKKMEAVSKAIAGDRIQPVAREIGVHRTSIHIWRERLWTGLQEALECHMS
jgi:transposase-like protein